MKCAAQPRRRAPAADLECTPSLARTRWVWCRAVWGLICNAAAIAMLVDEGKLKWDDPVTKYLPDFQLYDPYVTRELTVRDHCRSRNSNI